MKAVLFIHGNSLSGETFRAQMEDPKLQQLFRMHAIDLPGHGEAEKVPEYSLRLFADAVVEHLQAQEIKEVALVGHSLGGHIAIDIVGRKLDFEVTELLIFGTPPLKKPLDMSAFLPHPALGLAFQEHLTSEQIKEMAQANGTPDLREFIALTDPKIRAGLSVEIERGPEHDEVELLHHFKGRLAILHGQDDQLVNLPYILSLDLNLWRGDVQIVPNSGYSPQLENAKTFNQLLQAFL